MPRLRRRYDPAVGPVVSVTVSDPLGDRDVGEMARTETAQMLVDSGASDSSIHVSIAQRLGLPVLGYHDITGFGATKPTYQFLCDLEIVLDDGAFPLDDWKLLSFETEYDRIDGLLGRDVLSLGHFVFNGPDSTFELRFG